MTSARTMIDRPAVQFLRLSGGKPYHLICLPGLVPDGPETFARQTKLLRSRGSVAVVTYPHEQFDLDAVIAGVRGEVLAARKAGLAPLLMGVSVGGGIVLEMLRRAQDAGAPLPIRGLALFSPLTCIDDLSSMLSRLTRPILVECGKADGRPDIALERGRSLFKTLVTRATGDAAARDVTNWLGPLGLLTPQGFAAWNERRLAARIQATLDRIPAEGAVDRVMALTHFRGVTGLRAPLSDVPTLILWGSKERQTLDMDGPGTGRLCRPDLAVKVFPKAEVHWIYDRDGGEVPHASLLKHARAFNPPLGRWLRRIARAEGVGAIRSGVNRMTALLPAAMLTGRSGG